MWFNPGEIFAISRCPRGNHRIHLEILHPPRRVIVPGRDRPEMNQLASKQNFVLLA